MIPREEKAKDSDRNLSQCQFSHYRSHMDWPGIKPVPPPCLKN